MCNVMLMPAYSLCRGSLGGKDMARLNEFGGGDKAQKVKSGKICVLGRMINDVRDLNMEILVLVFICSYGIKPEDKQTRCLTVPINWVSPFTPSLSVISLYFMLQKYSLGIISFKTTWGSSSISIFVLFPRLSLILKLIISKASVAIAIIPYLHKIFIGLFMDFWKTNCKPNIPSTTSENIGHTLVSGTHIHY